MYFDIYEQNLDEYSTGGTAEISLWAFLLLKRFLSPRSTSFASASTNSQIDAISLIKLTEVARKALIACLVISADSTDIHSIFLLIGVNNLFNVCLVFVSLIPTTIRSGLRKTSKDLPRRRFSGEQAKCNFLFGN